MRLLANQRVCIEPDEPALVIESDATFPRRPVALLRVIDRINGLLRLGEVDVVVRVADGVADAE